NDHLQLQTIVTIAPDGERAYARGSELAMTGEHGAGGELGVNVLENTFVNEGGVWKIAAMRVFHRMRPDYAVGWAVRPMAPEGPVTRLPPDEPPRESAVYPDIAVPAFHYTHPVTGRAPQYPRGMQLIGEPAPLLTGARTGAAPPQSLDALSIRLD